MEFHLVTTCWSGTGLDELIVKAVVGVVPAYIIAAVRVFVRDYVPWD